MSTDKDESTSKPEQKVRARRLARTLESFNPENLAKKLAEAVGKAADKSGTKSADPSSSSSQLEPIAKTLLESEMPIDRGQSLSPKPHTKSSPKHPSKKASEKSIKKPISKTPEQISSKKTTGKSIKRVAKTMLGTGSDVAPPAKKSSSPIRNPDSGSLAKQRPSQQFVAKTLLDRNMIIEASARFSARKIERLEKVVAQRLLEPTKQITPVTAKKKVAGCPFSWDDDEGTDRLKICTACQSNIYDFEDIDEADAKTIIFKRENRKTFVFYERQDGKFMTSACPVASKRSKQKVMTIAATILVVVMIGTCFALMPPQQLGSDSVYQSSSTEPDTVHSPAKYTGTLRPTTPSSANSKSGHAKYNTEKIVIGKDAAKSSPKEEPAFTEAEERGEFWRF